MSAPATETSWGPAPAEPALGPGQLALWRVRLEGDLDEARALLTDAERARADRFVRAEHGQRWALARAALRRILSTHLGAMGAPTQAAAVELELGPYGKPALGPRVPGLGFNLSHSEGWALVGVGCELELGVDVERARPRTRLDRLARWAFSEAEAEAVLARPTPEARRAAFYAVWTRKEAYIKALGMGLALDLRSFEVSWDRPARLLGAPRGRGARALGDARAGGSPRVAGRAVRAPGLRAGLVRRAHHVRMTSDIVSKRSSAQRLL